MNRFCCQNAMRDSVASLAALLLCASSSFVLGDQGLAEFTANVCKRFLKSLDMHPLCRYLVNHLKAHQSFNLIVLEQLLTITTVRACIGRGLACACSYFMTCLWSARHLSADSPATSGCAACGGALIQ